MIKIKNVFGAFDGLSSGQIALQKLGIKYDKYYASEIETNAIKVTQANYPDTIQLGDITNLEFLPDIDLMIGGSPCQSFSFAGKQKGMTTTSDIEILTLEHYISLKNKGFEFEGQSYLFWEYMRMLKLLKPKYFLLENVAMNKKWERILTEAIGVEPIVINSSIISAGLRKRLYWTNIPNITQPIPKNITLAHILENGYTNRDKSYCIDANYGKGGNLMRYFHRSSRQLVFTDLEFMKSLSPKPDIKIANQIGRENKNKWRMLTPEECEAIQTVPIGYTSGVSKFWRYHMLGNGWTVDVIAHILSFIPDIDKL